MKAIREPGMISGFVLECPLPRLPCLTHINEVICLPRYRLGNHSHTGHEFHLLKSGSMIWEAAGRQYLQQTGELFIFPPGLPHRLACHGQPNGEVHALAMGLDLDLREPARPRLREHLKHLELRAIRGTFDYEPVMHALFRYCLRGGDRVYRVIEAYLDLFLTQLEEEPRNEVSNFENSSVYSYPIEKALHFMEENRDRKLSLGELGRVAHLAPTYFSRRFREEVGLSPVAHHLQLRLEAARRALENPGADLTAVALNHGFSSLQHLHSRFRRRYLVTPAKYRDQFRHAHGPKGKP